MRQFAEILRLRTPGRGLIEFTPEVVARVAARKVETGLLTLFCRHTSASLLIQENASPAVGSDIEAFLAALAPDSDDRYAHDEEGPDDMPAHLRAMLTGAHLSIPVIGGALALGTWQGIFLYEHRRRPHVREVALHLTAD